MIPRGLAVAIGIGAAAGAAFGAVLVGLADTNQLVFVEGTSLSVVTERTDYKRGEEIHIRIVNSGTEVLSFASTSYGLHVEQLDGVVLFSPVGGSEVSVLAPGEEAGFVWPQTKGDGKPVLYGRYKIISEGWSESQGARGSAIVNILK